jgi:hypothetical protein
VAPNRCGGNSLPGGRRAHLSDRLPGDRVRPVGAAHHASPPSHRQRGDQDRTGCGAARLAAYALLRDGIPRTATLPDKTPAETPGEPADDAGGIVPTAATSVLCVLVLLLIVEVPIVAFAAARERVRPPLERITQRAVRL